MNEKNPVERAYEIVEKEGWASVDERTLKAIERAMKEAALEERASMACGHPRACLQGLVCSVCSERNGLESLLLKTRGSAICRNFPEVLGYLDEAIAKLFRPIAMPGKPLSEMVIEDRR